MTKKKNIMVQILAILALLGIIISVIGTAVLVLTSGQYSNTQTPSELSPEELKSIINPDNITITTKDTEGEK